MIMRTVVVYVHGLWMLGLEGELLRRRLARRLSAATPHFMYRSVHEDVNANAYRLANRLTRFDVQTLHLVGHSLGGVIILKALEIAADALPPGRVVLLGSPLNGSRAAQTLAKSWIGRAVMGRSVADSLLSRIERRYAGNRDLGVIAGNRDVGLGRLVNRLNAPNDGTVYVDETRITGMKEHRVVSASHSGLPLSRSVAQLTAAFLQNGCFGS